MSQEQFQSSIADLTESIGLLIRRVRAAAASNELSIPESSVTGRLARNGPATTADLARSQNMKPQSMGATIASLEDRGLVERKPHPTDGRQQLIHLTPKGTALRKKVTADKLNWFAHAIEQLPEKDQKTLFAASRLFRTLVENDSQ